MHTKTKNPTLRTLVATLVAGSALIGAATASAQEVRPFALHADTASAHYGEAHLMPVGLQLSVGWHDNRYWDGHRYWAHDDWMRHHPHDPGPPHDHRGHRPPPRHY